MLTRRIIPCLDVDDGRVVKGIRFRDLRDAGDPAELGRLYAREGADELVFLDISATPGDRRTAARLAETVARSLFVPFTVGGGLRSVEDMREVLHAGADKVAVNTAAVDRPGLVTRAARRFGTQAVVVAVDARRREDGWQVHVRSGTRGTDRDAVAWAREAADRGAGEPADFEAAFRAGASAALAASLFHSGQLRIPGLKHWLAGRGIPVRYRGNSLGGSEIAASVSSDTGGMRP